jgi:RNA recognition motif-containing protein
LPFTIKDEEMYKFFEKCGKISYVRVIRDPKTFYGKGKKLFIQESDM